MGVGGGEGRGECVAYSLQAFPHFCAQGLTVSIYLITSCRNLGGLSGGRGQEVKGGGG